MHVESVYAQVVGCQVHAFKHLNEGLSTPALHVDNLTGVFLHGSLDKTQQVLLVHTGGCMYVCVYLKAEQTTNNATA